MTINEFASYAVNESNPLSIVRSIGPGPIEEFTKNQILIYSFIQISKKIFITIF